MCGIAGLVCLTENNGSNIERLVRSMAAELSHRGPDSDGAWSCASRGVGLAHRRLAIQDLSSAGHQPMTSKCGRYVAAFNGEIYNFRKLRNQLSGEGHIFEGHSDTEVMLASFCSRGIRDSLTDFAGMFAIAVVDRKSGRER